MKIGQKWCKSGPKIAKMAQIAAKNHLKLSCNDVKRLQLCTHVCLAPADGPMDGKDRLNVT